MTPDEPTIPFLQFKTDGLPEAEATAQWQQIMSPLFYTQKMAQMRAAPRGNLSMFLVGEIIVNRCTFNAQRFWRDPALIAATPDHLIVQYYRSGGFRGTIAGRSVCTLRGQVAIADLSRELEVFTASSDIIGLSVPRVMLAGIDPERLGPQLDAPRQALLARYMSSLPRRLARMTPDDIPRVTAEIVDLLHRVFSRRALEGGLPAVKNHGDLLKRACGFIEARLDDPDLSPVDVAACVDSSRASLYRLFAPMGGVQRFVHERRLLAVRDVLSDPLDKRSLAQLAADHGFKSHARFSRAFRTRFGMTPRAWRARQPSTESMLQANSPSEAHVAWRALGVASRESELDMSSEDAATRQTHARSLQALSS